MFIILNEAKWWSTHQSPPSRDLCRDRAHLLMDMAKMTGCQPDFRTSLTDGERRAIMTHTGMRSRKQQQTTGGRYHMSGKKHNTQRHSCQNPGVHSASDVEVGVWIDSLLRSGQTVDKIHETLIMSDMLKDNTVICGFCVIKGGLCCSLLAEMFSCNTIILLLICFQNSFVSFEWTLSPTN